MMSDVEQVWPADAFDAISIAAREGQFKIEGSDGNQVELKGDLDSRYWRDVQPEPLGRWLQLHLWRYSGGGELTLRLPKNKAWIVELSAGRGEIQVKNLQARLQLMLGKGEIRVEDSRGIIDLSCGNGTLEVKHWIETKMPERSPRPTDAPSPAATPDKDRSDRWSGSRDRTRMQNPWDVGYWDEEYWTEWGLQFAEKATAWATQFTKFFTNMDWKPGQAGLDIRTGKGDIRVQDVQAETCSLWLGKGDARMEDGRIAELVAYAGHGDFDCQAILPTGDWAIKTSHGNIRLALPADAQVKLDAATRHGDIHSDIPLVRVARPGPEARHGGRMVGTLGSTEGKTPELDLTTLNGDIVIEVRQVKSRPAQKPATESATASSNAVPRHAGADTTGLAAAEKGDSATTDQPTYDSHIAVLQALSEGKLTVEEAERLLRRLES
jgi:hypothetical protein